MDFEILTEQRLRDIYYDPSEGYQSAERLYLKAKEKGLSVSRRMEREWLWTRDTYTRYKPIVRKHKNLKIFVKTSRPGTTGPGRHGKIRKQEQRLPMDTDGCQDFEPVRLYDTRLQEGHQEHDEGRRPSVWKILKEGSVSTRTLSSLRREKSLTTLASGIF